VRILRAIWWAAFPLMVCAELEWVPDGTPQSVFGGADRKIRVAFANPTGRTIQTNLRTRLYQASSATAMPLGPARTWKEIEVPPGQTVMESVSLAFPAVNAKTRFLVQWLDTRGRMLGPTEVSVYPTNLLGELEALAGEAPPGLLDPQDRLKPLLLRARIDFRQLESSQPEQFNGKLVFVGPPDPGRTTAAEFFQLIKALAKRRIGVVWFRSDPDPDCPMPIVWKSESGGTIVVVPIEMLADLPGNPRSQIRLVRLARLALDTEPLTRFTP